MLAQIAPTDQRAGVRPIAFMLDDAGALSPPVILPIRPEDLSRTEPLRATVHQTMGRDVTGWVDNFGRGLPTINISGTTGWRVAAGLGLDGVQSFEALNTLVARDFPEAQQQAIERGIDPALVKLIFIDMLDGFAYPVQPLQFVLRRSKSRPLLIQYQIQMQAIATDIEFPVVDGPDQGDVPAGLDSLDAEAQGLQEWLPGLGSSLQLALSFVGGLNVVALAAPIAAFLGRAVDVFATAGTSIRTAQTPAAGLSGGDARLAAGLASASVNVLRTLASFPLIAGPTQAELSRGAGRYNTVVCLFANSLRDRQLYEDYSGLYGASGCSSTTGGRPVSKYADTNTFAQIDFGTTVARASGEALSSIAALAGMDPVLAPMPVEEIARHAGIIAAGVTP